MYLGRLRICLFGFLSSGMMMLRSVLQLLMGALEFCFVGPKPVLRERTSAVPREAASIRCCIVLIRRI